MTKKKIYGQYSLIIPLIFIAILFLPVVYFNYTDIDDFVFLERLHNNYHHINILNFFFPKKSVQYYRPLLELISYVDYALWGLSNRGFHLTNYLFHLLNSVLVFLICRHKIQDDRCPYWPSIAMLLFACHPIVCESVAWISGRSDIFGAFFSLLAVLFYFKAKNRYNAWTMLFILLGLFSKENALAVIPILFVLHIFHVKTRSIGNKFQESCFFGCLLCIPLGIYLLMRTKGLANHDYSTLQAAATSMNMSFGKGTIFSHMYTVMASVGFYVKKLIWPYPLNFAISTIHDQAYFIFSLFLVLLSAGLVFKKAYGLFAGLVLICLSFSPALLVVVGEIAWVPYAERYLYLSASLFAISLTLVIKHYVEKQKAMILLLVIVSVYTVSTVRRESIWRNSDALWADTYEKNPTNSKVIYKYAKTLGPEKGIEYHRLAVKMEDVDHARNSWKDFSYLAIAQYELNRGHVDAALNAIHQALNIRSNASNYLEAARLTARISDSVGIKGTPLEESYLTEAAEYYQTAYQLKKNPFSAYYAGNLYLRVGQIEQARALFETIVAIHKSSKYATLSTIQLSKMGGKWEK